MAEAGRYRQPLAKTGEYLDGIDATRRRTASRRRVLAALGPKMLELARTRAGGTHPYLVTPEHTAVARDALGAGLAAPARAGRGARDRPGPAPGRSPVRTSRPTWPCRTTPTTGSASGSPRTTSPTAAATGSSTPSWRGATKPTIDGPRAGAPRRRRRPRVHPGSHRQSDGPCVGGVAPVGAQRRRPSPDVVASRYAGIAIITEACIDVKDRACVDVCPVQCIYEFDPAKNMLFSEERGRQRRDREHATRPTPTRSRSSATASST